MAKTPLWNQLLIYVGITFSFLFILVFVRLLTPEIPTNVEKSVSIQQIPNGFSIAKRPYYAIVGLVFLVAVNILVMILLWISAFIASSKDRNHAPKNVISYSQGQRRSSNFYPSSIVSRNHSSLSQYAV